MGPEGRAASAASRASIVIHIAEGWPSSGLAAAKAEALGERLIEAAKLAKKMAPSD